MKPLIQFDDISKEYHGRPACVQIHLEIAQSRIHAVVGENGAGKSTLMKILGGLVAPSRGRMSLKGKPYLPRSAQDAFSQKIAFIHQHFVLARQMTAFENILLSCSSSLNLLNSLPAKQTRLKTEALLKKFNWTIPLDRKVDQISVGEQQRLEILKALLLEPEILIFDEPTAVLTPQESDDLMNFLLKLKDDGKTVILISHKLNEIKKVADRVTIMRAGKIVLTEDMKNLSIDQIAESMIGRKAQKSFNLNAVIGENHALTLPGTEIKIRKGEIFGVAGIEGHGQSELIEKLIQTCRKNKISFGDITEDRLPLSVFQSLSLMDHVILKHPELFSRNGLLLKNKAQNATQHLIKKWDVRPGLADQSLIELSGGNQQKFIVGRELLHEPDVLIAAHPTRGVDLGAQEFIHRALIDFAKKKKVVFLFSSDLDEVLQLSDRFVILYHHGVLGPFAKNSLSELQIGRYMTGHQS